MFRTKLAFSALILSAAMLSPAKAAPVTPADAVIATTDSSLIQVTDRRDRDHDRYDRDDWRRGHRGPPPGWHRYHRRPHDWRTRGCLEIGPLWFCP